MNYQYNTALPKYHNGTLPVPFGKWRTPRTLQTGYGPTTRPLQ